MVISDTLRIVIRTNVAFVVFFWVIGIISPVAAQPSPESAPATVRDILPGGLHLLVEERKGSPLTALDIRVRAGSGREAVGQNGIAHFVEHMIFKGSASRPSGAIDAEMEKIGGEVSARTTRDTTHFSTVVPSARWKEALALLTEGLLSPAFRAEDVQAEAQVIAAEMAVARTSPEKTAFSRIAALAYDTNDPARLPLMGTESMVRGVTPEALRAFHGAWYRTENITIALVGDIKPEEARKFVAFLFRSSGTAPVSRPEVSTYVPLGRVARALPASEQEQQGRELTTVVVAFRAPSVRSGDLLPLFDTLLPILANGGSGRLVNRLVKQEGVALSVTADFVPGRNTSLLLITIVTRPKQAPFVEKSLLEEIKRLAEDALIPDETNRAIETVLGRIAYASQSVRERASWLASLDIAAPSLDPTTYIKRVETIKTDELNKMVGLYLTPLSYAVAVVGPPPPETSEDTEGRAVR